MLRQGAGLFGLIFAVTISGASARAGGPLARSLKPDMQPFVDTVLAKDANKPNLILFGEVHGVAQFHEFYTHALTALKKADPEFNCLFIESHYEFAPLVDKFMQQEITASQVNVTGLQNLFKSWGLYDVAPHYDWNKTSMAIAKDAILSPQLLTTARKLNMNVVPVDHLVLQDFVNMTYLEIQRTQGDNAASAHVAESGLTEYLDRSPKAYYKKEIIDRRNQVMAQNIADKLQSGECKKGLAIVGAMHAFKMVAGGARVYSKDSGMQPMNQLLKEQGVQPLVFNFLLSTHTFGFEHVPANHPGLNYRIDSRWKSPVPWRENVDYDAAVIIKSN